MTTEDFKPGPPAEVAWHTSDSRATLVFVRKIGHPPEKVWAALTEVEQLMKWAPFAPDHDLSSTGSALLTMIDGRSTEQFPSMISRAIRPELLEYTWGDNLLVWELTPIEGGTRLTLHHTAESPDWLPKLAAGWHICLDVAQRLLDGNPVGPIVGLNAQQHGWKRLHDYYSVTLNIESSV